MWLNGRNRKKELVFYKKKIIFVKTFFGSYAEPIMLPPELIYNRYPMLPGCLFNKYLRVLSKKQNQKKHSIFSKVDLNSVCPVVLRDKS